MHHTLERSHNDFRSSFRTRLQLLLFNRSVILDFAHKCYMQTAQCPAQYHSRESLVTEIVNKKKHKYIFSEKIWMS